MNPPAGRLLLLLFIICFGKNIAAQVAAVRVNVYVPAIDKADANVYISGNFNYWHSGDSVYRMHNTGQQQYSITLPLFAGRHYEYKYTLGSWERVETASNDSNISNRSFTSADGAVINDTVAKWKPTQADKKMTSQQQQLKSMKDSAIAGLKPVLADMQNLLQQYAQNLLREKPKLHVQKRLDRKMKKQLGKLYGHISQLLQDAMATLTPQQKQAISQLLQHPQKKDDFINNFQGAFNSVISNNK